MFLKHESKFNVQLNRIIYCCFVFFCKCSNTNAYWNLVIFARVSWDSNLNTAFRLCLNPPAQGKIIENQTSKKSQTWISCIISRLVFMYLYKLNIVMNHNNYWLVLTWSIIRVLIDRTKKSPNNNKCWFHWVYSKQKTVAKLECIKIWQKINVMSIWCVKLILINMLTCCWNITHAHMFPLCCLV